jgi:radical SAM-linked protein
MEAEYVCNRRVQQPRRVSVMNNTQLNRVLLYYARTGSTAWLAHLDMMRLFSRAMNRAAWPLAWSEGAFNPRPDIVFGLPAGCGIELERDPVEIGLDVSNEALAFDLEDAVRRLNTTLPESVRVVDAAYTEPVGKSLMSRVFAATYRIEALGVSSAYTKTFTGAPVMVEHVRKKKTTTVELTSKIMDADVSDDNTLLIVCGAGSVNHLRIDLLLKALVRDGGLSPEGAAGARLVRESVLINTVSR